VSTSLCTLDTTVGEVYESIEQLIWKNPVMTSSRSALGKFDLLEAEPSRRCQERCAHERRLARQRATNFIQVRMAALPSLAVRGRADHPPQPERDGSAFISQT
jgi:hypothetical protein